MLIVSVQSENNAVSLILAQYFVLLLSGNNQLCIILYRPTSFCAMIDNLILYSYNISCNVSMVQCQHPDKRAILSSVVSEVIHCLHTLLIHANHLSLAVTLSQACPFLALSLDSLLKILSIATLDSSASRLS